MLYYNKQILPFWLRQMSQGWPWIDGFETVQVKYQNPVGTSLNEAVLVKYSRELSVLPTQYRLPGRAEWSDIPQINLLVMQLLSKTEPQHPTRNGPDPGNSASPVPCPSERWEATVKIKIKTTFTSNHMWSFAFGPSSRGLLNQASY